MKLRGNTGPLVDRFLHLADAIYLPDVRISPMLAGRFADPELGRTLLEFISSLGYTSAESFCGSQQGNHLVNAVLSFQTMTLEEELRSILAAVIPPNHSTTPFLSRLGWDGEKRVTLREAGEHLGITRERVRQIQLEIEGKLRTTSVWAPALSLALDSIVGAVPFALSALGEVLQEYGAITGRTFHYESLRHAVQLLAPHRLNDFGVERQLHLDHPGLCIVTGSPNHALSNQMHTIVQLLDQGKSEWETYGFARFSELDDQKLTALNSLRFNLKALVELNPGIVSTNNVLVVNTRDHERNALLTRLKKILAIVPNISLNTAAEQIQRDTYRGKFVSEVELFLIINAYPAWSVRDGRINSTSTYDISDLVEEHELAFLKILDMFPGSQLRELRPHFLRAKVSEERANQLLSYSPLVRRSGSIREYRYQLIGPLTQNHHSINIQNETAPYYEHLDHMDEVDQPGLDFGNDQDRRAELTAMNLITLVEESVGRNVRDVSNENLGWDIESTDRFGGSTIRIEAKARISKAITITITSNELAGYFSDPDKFILAVVLLSSRNNPEIYYIRDPFESALDKNAVSANFHIGRLLKLPTARKVSLPDGWERVIPPTKGNLVAPGQ